MVRTIDGHDKAKAPSEHLWLVIEHRSPEDYRCHLTQRVSKMRQNGSHINHVGQILTPC